MKAVFIFLGSNPYGLHTPTFCRYVLGKEHPFIAWHDHPTYVITLMTGNINSPVDDANRTFSSVAQCDVNVPLTRIPKLGQIFRQRKIQVNALEENNALPGEVRAISARKLPCYNKWLDGQMPCLTICEVKPSTVYLRPFRPLHQLG